MTVFSLNYDPLLERAPRRPRRAGCMTRTAPIWSRSTEAPGCSTIKALSRIRCVVPRDRSKIAKRPKSDSRAMSPSSSGFSRSAGRRISRRGPQPARAIASRLHPRHRPSGLTQNRARLWLLHRPALQACGSRAQHVHCSNPVLPSRIRLAGVRASPPAARRPTPGDCP